ncbi:MAG: hypothetical protein IJX17_05620 [Clostridia bacterium]|nr:hypothetical protein [Clostridia bacterium]
MEFKRSEYKLFENAIEEVSKRLSGVFNEVGKLEYDIHKPKENGTKGYRIYDNYCHWGSLVVEPNSVYVGYEWNNYKRFLVVYIDNKFLESAVGVEKILEIFKEKFGEFKIREEKEEYKECCYRVYKNGILDIDFTRETREKLFENSNNYIAGFCIVFGADYKRDKYKFSKAYKKKKEEVIY